MSTELPIPRVLPPEADGAVEIVRALRRAGCEALLAGGCVRDLLLGESPKDYDVATDAPPQRVAALFPRSRHVGAQFGVMLVRIRGRWIEVATFRTDGPYLDGRRPSEVVFTNAQHDAQRRDFTINGMFLDPLGGRIIDYVGGSADLASRRVRAIGDPGRRFSEDYLRLLRAVRFAARLGFDIEPQTLAAIRTHAPRLADVAVERVREELEKMLCHPARADAFDWLRRAELLPHLWRGAEWSDAAAEAASQRVRSLPADAPFSLTLAALLADRTPAQVHELCRSLSCSNEVRETAAWLVENQRALDDPDAISLAALKRLMAADAFDMLRTTAEGRYESMADGAERCARLRLRIEGIAPEAVRPPPLVTGDDLAARAVPPGPVYKRVLDALYTLQLEEQLTGREQALRALDRLLAEISDESSSSPERR